MNPLVLQSEIETNKIMGRGKEILTLLKKMLVLSCLFPLALTQVDTMTTTGLHNHNIQWWTRGVGLV